MTKANEISKRYGETTLRMALTHLFQVGISNLKNVDVDAACKQIKAETPDNYIMTPELRCDVMRCAVELAQESVWDILSFVQTNIKIDGVAVHPGVIIEFRRNSDGQLISNCVLPADTGAETLDSVFELVDTEKEIYLSKHGSLYGFDYEGTINKALKGIGVSRLSVEPDNVYYI